MGRRLENHFGDQIRKESVMTARMKIRRQVVRASGQWPGDILRNIFWTYLEWDLASGKRLHSYENGDRNSIFSHE